IRRDLEKCQTNGLLKRCHGGAVLAGLNRQEISFEDKTSENTGVKRSIARFAASLVDEGMAVFIDAGTTAFEIAKNICGLPNITIISNDVHTIHLLLHSKAQLICIGGSMQKTTGSAFDEFSMQMLEQMHFDIAFFGANSIDSKYHVATPTQGKMFFKRKVMSRAYQNFLVVDNSKFNKNALYSINHLREYDGVITDYNFENAELDMLRDDGITVIHIPNDDETGNTRQAV
ncbi:MAG: DeoR/GlpR family DNA-binding transcription regulator, partial [Treponema sp.]|nr:DeoR/GlpR family DNA-binding transcription regulator [Treponema sp.]